MDKKHEFISLYSAAAAQLGIYNKSFSDVSIVLVTLHSFRVETKEFIETSKCTPENVKIDSIVFVGNDWTLVREMHCNGNTVAWQFNQSSFNLDYFKKCNEKKKTNMLFDYIRGILSEYDKTFEDVVTGWVGTAKYNEEEFVNVCKETAFDPVNYFNVLMFGGNWILRGITYGDTITWDYKKITDNEEPKHECKCTKNENVILSEIKKLNDKYDKLLAAVQQHLEKDDLDAKKKQESKTLCDGLVSKLNSSTKQLFSAKDAIAKAVTELTKMFSKNEIKDINTIEIASFNIENDSITIVIRRINGSYDKDLADACNAINEMICKEHSDVKIKFT